MALQAQHGLAHLEQVPMHGPVRGVTLQAAFRYRNVLVGERTLKLRVATKTKLVEIVGAQVVGGGSAVRIVTVRAAHLGLADRMMIGEIAFRRLLAMAADARLALLPPGVQLRLAHVRTMAVGAPDIAHLV